MAEAETVPTPEQIRQACLEIQAGWTERERYSRLRPDWRPTRWIPPAVAMDLEPDTAEREAG